MKKLRKVLLVLVVILAVGFVGIQFVPGRERTNPPVTMEVDAPPEVLAILRRACYDCHSNETVWPWYAKVAPMKWLVSRDVSMGREHMNLSEWDALDDDERMFTREEILEEVESGEMPPWFYVPLHAEAKLTDADIAVLEAWVDEN